MAWSRMPAGINGGPAMWTAADRERYGRDGLRYPSDLTEAEWALIAPLIRPAKRGGRRRSVVVREVMNGLLYVLETGCQWRHLPRALLLCSISACAVCNRARRFPGA